MASFIKCLAINNVAYSVAKNSDQPDTHLMPIKRNPIDPDKVTRSAVVVITLGLSNLLNLDDRRRCHILLCNNSNGEYLATRLRSLNK